MMEAFGTIVEYCQEKNTAESLSCSGIYMGKGVVLTHGTIVIDILKDRRAQPLVQELVLKGYTRNGNKANVLNSVLQSTQSSFQVLLPAEQFASSLESAQANKQCLNKPMNSKDYNNQMQKENAGSLFPIREQNNIFLNGSQISWPSRSLQKATSNYLSFPASVDLMFFHPGIKKSIASIMPASDGWKFRETAKYKYAAALETLIISTFVLLKIIPEKSHDYIMEASSQDVIYLTQKMLSFTGISSKGMTVYVESSPFGSLAPGVFLNSLSSGIISNVDHIAANIMFTDARCIMGSEGAPVFTVIEGMKHLCGLVISPFCWRDGEWLGLTLLASANQVLQTLLCSLKSEVDKEDRKAGQSLRHDKSIEIKHLGQSLDHIPRKEYLKSEYAHHLNRGIVAVCCGKGYGSGIIINTSPGVILTCAHVTHPATSGDVRIILSDGRSLQGQVIHQTQPSTLNHQTESGIQEPSVWDLAVITTTSTLPFALPLASKLPPKGSSVVVAGYGIFSPRCLPTPTLSQGVMSKVVSFPLYMFQWPTHLHCQECSKFSLKNTDKCNNGIPVTNLRDDVLKQKNDSIRIADLKDKNTCIDFTKKDNFLSVTNRFTDGDMFVSSNTNNIVPVIMQTTCAVYAGTSGGAVVSVHPQHGLEVIGVVVCNTCDTFRKATFPHINLAVPSPAIFKIIETFISCGDKTVLKYLDAECSAASQLWLLGLTPQSRL